MDDLVKRLLNADLYDDIQIANLIHESRNRIEQLNLDIVGLKIKNTKLEAALEKIASCQSHHPDDVVAVARAALGEKKDA